MTVRLCPCHGVPMRRDKYQWRCLVKKRARNNIATAKYRQTAKGRATTRSSNARRIYIGQRAVTHAKTVDEAQRINAHIQAQLAARRADQKEAYGAVAR